MSKIIIAQHAQGKDNLPLQNRVDPFGNLVRTPARGTFMGNRGGALHNPQQEIERTFKNRRWITCVLEFRGRYRSVMTPRRYTELFFLDEAVAFAAGHRPCAECRRERFNAFKRAWQRRKGSESDNSIYADPIDEELHRSRIDNRKVKITYEAPVGSLPNGCFVSIEDQAFLIWDGRLLLWSPEGYLSIFGYRART